MSIGLFKVSLTWNFDESLLSNSEGSTTCVYLNNQLFQARGILSDINFNETLFHPFTVSVNKCGKSYYTIDDPYARVCASNNLKNINAKVFNVECKLNKIFSSTWAVWV